jgi:7-cyano-7-deazaguanine reductase
VTDDAVELPPLTLLGRTVDAGEATGLEFFEVDRPVRVTFTTGELQALCPAVAQIQPDLYDAELSYTAVTHAVESKSLKLWLVGFRDRRIFAEHLAVELHDALAAYEPAVRNVRVRLVQHARGGITTVVEHPAD